jgi:hypothetical protein
LPLRITTTDNPNWGEKSGILGEKPTNIREKAGILKENQQASTRNNVSSLIVVSSVFPFELY